MTKVKESWVKVPAPTLNPLSTLLWLKRFAATSVTLFLSKCWGQSRDENGQKMLSKQIILQTGWDCTAFLNSTSPTPQHTPDLTPPGKLQPACTLRISHTTMGYMDTDTNSWSILHEMKDTISMVCLSARYFTAELESFPATAIYQDSTEWWERIMVQPRKHTKNLWNYPGFWTTSSVPLWRFFITEVSGYQMQCGSMSHRHSVA